MVNDALNRIRIQMEKCFHPWSRLLPLSLLFTPLAGVRIEKCIISYHMSCHNHTSSWLTNHSTGITNTTNTNLRVSISMFISGLRTTLAVVGPDTFIDEARFSIRRCLSLSLSSPSFQYKLLSSLDVWKFDSLSSKYRRQLKNVWGGLRLPRL